MVSTEADGAWEVQVVIRGGGGWLGMGASEGDTPAVRYWEGRAYR
jgi:hypothetical protein